MRTIYLGFWDNQLDDAKEKQEGLDIVINAVETEGAVRVSFDYIGRTRHERASHNMVRLLIDRGKNYEYIIGYNYKFEIYKNDEIKRLHKRKEE